MARDYASFSGAAKSRFRPVAKALGYEQRSAILYVRDRNGWEESFNLQIAGHGNPFFYVNYGITVPKLCPIGVDRSIHTCGNLLGDRLRNADGTGAFPCGSLTELEDSANQVLAQFNKIARPWFESMSSWTAMAAEYLRTNNISEDAVGRHSPIFGQGPRCATYAYLLLKCGRTDDAIRWLNEAERVLCLPQYRSKAGYIVCEKEKYARLLKPEAYELETLAAVRATLDWIAQSGNRGIV